MLQAMSITLREGFEAALVIGIMLSYAVAAGRDHLRRPIAIGVALAAVASIFGALALKSVGIDPENAAVEGVLYLTASVFVASMVAWMWRSARSLREQVGAKLDAADSRSLAGSVSVGTFAFFMVAREGVETVLLMAANVLDQGLVPSLIGGAIGLVAAVALGYAVYRGASLVDTKMFFTATTVALLLLAARFFGVGLLELGEAGVIALPEAAEEALELLEDGLLAGAISLAVIALPVGAIGWSLVRGRRHAVAA